MVLCYCLAVSRDAAEVGQDVTRKDVGAEGFAGAREGSRCRSQAFGLVREVWQVRGVVFEHRRYFDSNRGSGGGGGEL